MTEDFQVLSHVKCTLPIAHFCSGLNASLADDLALEYSRQDIAALLLCWYSFS
jgi:hypothetical protein